MAISVTEPIGWAFTRMGRMLFKPFDIRKWFVLGFCAWLAQLSEGRGVNFNPGGWRPGGRGGNGPRPFGPVLEWGREHIGLVILLAVVVFLVMVAVGLVILWLSSRGKFMFVDGVVRNRGAVVEPWHRFRALGDSLFWFRLVLGAGGLMVLALIVAGGVGIAWPDIRAEEFGGSALAALLVSVLLFSLAILCLGLIAAVLEDFVVPVMYVRGVRTLAAWGGFRRELLPGRFWTFVLFYLMKFILGIGVVVIAMLATCLTCCLAALPYLGTVILLPVFVFMRLYSLHFLEQFGPEWRFFPPVVELSPAEGGT